MVVPGTLQHLLTTVAAQAPDRPACTLPSGPSRSLTYGDLQEQSRRAASGLRRLGLTRGDRLGVWLPTVPEWLVLQFAAAQLGAVVVAVNPRYRGKELLDVLGTSAATAVVLPTAFLEVDGPALLAEVAPQLPALRSTVLLDLEPRGPLPTGLPGPLSYEDLLRGDPLDGSAGTPEDLVAVFTTSGTTSAPKLAAHTQRTVARHGENVAKAFDVRGGDTCALTLPMAGVFGFSTAMGALAAGATLLMQPLFDAAELAGWLAEGRVTHLNAADNMFTVVLDALPEDRSRMRWRDGGFASFSGGGVDLVQRTERLTGVRLTGLYGSSEGFALAARWSPDLPAHDRARAGGVPVSAEIEVRAADPNTGQALPDEQRGELQFRGYNICREYYANAVATAASRTSDDWFCSGDLGFTVVGGGFVYLSRLKDTLRLRGFLTDPAEIEEFLGTHPGVRLAQVVGATLPGRGDVAVAFVQPLPGVTLTAQEVQDHCRGRLADYKVPARVVVVDAFPTVFGPNGEKIQKNRLRQQAQALLDG